MEHPAPLQLFLQRMAKESPSVIQQTHDTECKVKTDVAWIPGWVLRLASRWVSHFRFWIGVSRPASNRYRIRKKKLTLLGFLGGSSQICFYMSFRFEILDRSFQTDITPIQKPKHNLLFENSHLSYGMWRGARLRPIWNRYETETKCYLSCVGNLYTPDTWNAQPRWSFSYREWPKSPHLLYSKITIQNAT